MMTLVIQHKSGVELVIMNLEELSQEVLGIPTQLNIHSYFMMI